MIPPDTHAQWLECKNIETEEFIPVEFFDKKVILHGLELLRN